MIKPTSYLCIVLTSLIVCGCGASSPDVVGANADTITATEPRSKYAMANGCYALQSLRSNLFALDNGGQLHFSTIEAGSAAGLFMRPATLGKYLLYTRSEEFVAAAGAQVSITSEPSDAAIWNVTYDEAENSFQLENFETGQYLSAPQGEGAATLLGVATATTNFRFEPIASNLCAEYPEMPVAVRGTTFKGRGVDQPIIGFADVHGHVTTTHETSIFDTDQGGAFAEGLYGQPAHKFGVTHALHDCREHHGEGGVDDTAQLITAQQASTAHDTVGWPTFIDWPSAGSHTHHSTYYRWIERAWMAGQRVLVNMTSNFNPLCELGAVSRRQPDLDCDDMNITRKQIALTYEMQDYIDAQHGGPGQGWFQVVTTPQQAREVINDGKMAVILATEVGQIFGCTLSYDALGNETSGCTTDDIDEQMDELWDLGVRHIMPYHDGDTSLGGSGLFGGVTAEVLSAVNFYETGQFFKTEECREWPEDEPSVSDPGFVASTPSTSPESNAAISALYDLAGATGLVPVYPPGKQLCNLRKITELGDYAIRRLMENGFVVDIDHAEHRSKDIMLDIADEMDPPYVWVSTHSAHGGMSSDQAARLLAQGGLIYKYKLHGRVWAQDLEDLKFWREKAGPNALQHTLAMGIGVDPNGFGGHTGPRPSPKEPVTYPITLFQGNDWGPQFSGFEPVYVDLLTVPESGKFWHIDDVGQAHYGMVADFVEEVRLEAGEEGLTALYNSAEDYIRVWEQVYSRNDR